jgi:hypothetical protein
VKDTVSSGAQSVGEGVANVAQKAKVPLVAGGAALAGLAGAAVIAATRSNRRRTVLGVRMPKTNGFKVDAQKLAKSVGEAAKRADELGQQVSRIASGVQTVSDTANKAAKKT